MSPRHDPVKKASQSVQKPSRENFGQWQRSFHFPDKENDTLKGHITLFENYQKCLLWNISWHEHSTYKVKCWFLARKNSNFFNLKLNAARFTRKVVNWDFLNDFQTLWHEVNSSLLLLLQHYLCDFLEVFSGSNFEGHQSSLSEVLKNHCLLHCPNLCVWKQKKRE